MLDGVEFSEFSSGTGGRICGQLLFGHGGEAFDLGAWDSITSYKEIRGICNAMVNGRRFLGILLVSECGIPRLRKGRLLSLSTSIAYDMLLLNILLLLPLNGLPLRLLVKGLGLHRVKRLNSGAQNTNTTD